MPLMQDPSNTDTLAFLHTKKIQKQTRYFKAGFAFGLHSPA